MKGKRPMWRHNIVAFIIGDAQKVCWKEKEKTISCGYGGTWHRAQNNGGSCHIEWKKKKNKMKRTIRDAMAICALSSYIIIFELVLCIHTRGVSVRTSRRWNSAGMSKRYLNFFHRQAEAGILRDSRRFPNNKYMKNQMINAFRVTRRGGDSIGWRENLQKEAVGLRRYGD